MHKLAETIGKRIRSYRQKREFSQEQLAELCALHPTYIGQIERGEKNATIETIAKISAALNVSLSELFVNLGAEASSLNKIPADVYSFFLLKTPEEQEKLYRLLQEIDAYRQNG